MATREEGGITKRAAAETKRAAAETGRIPLREERPGSSASRPAVRGAPPTDRQAAGADGEMLSRAVERAAAGFLALQHPDGYWLGELEADITLNAEYVLFLHFMGLSSGEGEAIRKSLEHIRRHQNPDGSWSIYRGGPGSLSATIEAYFAFKLGGHSPDEPHMAKAREFVLSRGGVMSARMLTKFYLTYFGQFDWEGIPSMPPALILLPAVSTFSIYEFACWARSYTVPLFILNTKRPRAHVPPGCGVEELYCVPRDRIRSYAFRSDAKLISWENFFCKADRMLKFLDRCSIRLAEGTSLRRTEAWILERQNADGGWGGIFPAMINSMMALKVLGHPNDHPAIAKGLEALRGFQIVEEDHLRQQACVSPVWDTCWGAMLLDELSEVLDGSVLTSKVEEARSLALDWLVARQVLRQGDWSVKTPHVEPGGWAFQFHNDFYPDNDDTAAVLMGLAAGMRRQMRPSWTGAFTRGLRWLFAMQNDDGGWASFERNINKEIYNALPFNDCKNMLDPSTPDLAGRALECLGRVGYRPDFPPAARCIRYLRASQEPDGSWFGRWGVNYIYGTWSVLMALEQIGVPPDDPMVRRGADWLESVRNPDGGWGESCASYEGGPPGVGRTTASQTAWALMGLIAAGRGRSEAARRGAGFLVETQEADGLWSEEDWTGTGFPGAFYIKYHYYSKYFPALALARYRRALER